MKLFITYNLFTNRQFVMLATLSAFISSAYATTLHEDFEGIGGSISAGNGVSNFNVGTANFTGGMSGVAGIFELYNSGSHAWMVKGGETGTIQLGPNTTEVSFYAKAFSGADGTSVITAFDEADNILKTLTVEASNPFTLFSILGAIDRIEFVNNDSSNMRMNSLDDFSVTSVPIPAAFWLFGTAILSLIGASKEKFSA